MFRTTSLLVGSPGRLRSFVGGQRLAVTSHMSQQHRVLSTTEDQSTEQSKDVESSPSRGQLELASSKMCLQHCKRLRAEEESVDNSLSLLWLKRAELEMRKAVHSFGPDLPQSPHQPMVEQHMLDLESVCENLESSNTEFATDPDEKEYVHVGGALGKAVAEAVIWSGLQVLGERARVPLEYVVRRPAIYHANSRILQTNGRSESKIRSFQKLWALACGPHLPTYPLSEFLLGAEMAFGSFFHSLHSGDYKSLESMLSEDLFATFPVDNATSDLLKDVLHADTGGYEVEEATIEAIEAHEAIIGGEETKVVTIEVKFICRSFVDVAVDGTAIFVKPREEAELVPIKLTFFSPLPWEIPGAADLIGNTDFDWRIANIDTQHVNYLDADN